MASEGIEIDTVALPTGVTGNQVLTLTNLGSTTPVAAIVIVSQASAAGTPASDMVVSIGFTDGVEANTTCVGCSAEHNVGTTDDHRTATAGLIDIKSAGTGISVGAATFNAFGSGSLTINITNAFETAFIAQIWSFYGASVSKASFPYNATGTQDTAQDITSVGFASDLVFCATSNSAEGGAGANSELGFGFADNAITQKSFCYAGSNGQATSSTGGQMSSNRVVANCNATGSLSWALELSAIDASGFTVTPRDGAGGNVIFLCIKFNAASSHVEAYTSPTSTGADATTGFGYAPIFVGGFITAQTAIDTAATDGKGSAFGLFGISDSQDGMTCWHEQDNVGTSNCQSQANDLAMDLLEHDGTDHLISSSSSLDADGFTITYSTVQASALQGAIVAVQDDAAVSSIQNLLMGENLGKSLLKGANL